MDGAKLRLAVSSEDVVPSRNSGAGFVIPRQISPHQSDQSTGSVSAVSTAPLLQVSRAMSPQMRHASPMAKRENRRAALMVDLPNNFNFEDLAAEFAKDEYADSSSPTKSSKSQSPLPLVATSVSDPIPHSPNTPSPLGRISPALPSKSLSGPAMPPQKSASVKPDLQSQMQSSSNSVAEGIALVKQAVEHDCEGRLPSALQKYQAAIVAFSRALKEETNPAISQSLQGKVAEYSKRCAVIQQTLESQSPSSASPVSPQAQRPGVGNSGGPMPSASPQPIRDRKMSIAEGPPGAAAAVVAQRAVVGRERKLSASNAAEANITDNERFRAIFSLSESEQLLQDCAMSLELNGQSYTGRMFLSTGWLCFSALNHTEKVRWPEIADMQRKRSMMGSRLEISIKSREAIVVFKTLLLHSDQIFDVCQRLWGSSVPPPDVFGVPIRDLIARESAKKVCNKNIPFVISYSAEYIRAHGLGKDGIFRVSVGNEALERLAIAVKYNDHIAFDREDGPYEAAALIKKFLRDLPVPLSNPSLYSLYITIARLPRTADFLPSLLVKLRQVLNEESETDRAVLAYIVQLLAVVAANSSTNRMDAKNLSLLFGPIIFRPPANASLNSSLTDIPAVCSLVYLFITEYSRIFEQ